jgi:hypothetical protein
MGHVVLAYFKDIDLSQKQAIKSFFRPSPNNKMSFASVSTKAH